MVAASTGPRFWSSVDIENETHPVTPRIAIATRDLRRDPPPPPFTAPRTLEGGTATVMFRGELDIAGVAILLDSLLGIAFVAQKLVLDFSELEFIDACGLRTVASTMQQVRTCGGTVSIRSPSPRIERLLELVDVHCGQGVVTEALELGPSV